MRFVVQHPVFALVLLLLSVLSAFKMLNSANLLFLAQFKQPPLLVQTTVQQPQVQITAQQHQVQIMAQQPHHSETTRDKKPDKKEGEDANSAGAGLVNVTADGVNKVDEVETDLSMV